MTIIINHITLILSHHISYLIYLISLISLISLITSHLITSHHITSYHISSHAQYYHLLIYATLLNPPPSTPYPTHLNTLILPETTAQIVRKMTILMPFAINYAPIASPTAEICLRNAKREKDISQN